MCPERRGQAKGRPPLDRVVQRQTRGENHRRAKSRRPQKSASKDQRRLGDEEQHIGNYDDDDDDEKKTTERDGDGKTAANETTAENNNATNAREVFDKALSKKLTTMPIPSGRVGT